MLIFITTTKSQVIIGRTFILFFGFKPGSLNTIKVFAEVLLWDVEVCRRTVLDKKWCKDQTLDLPTLMCSIRLASVYPGRTKTLHCYLRRTKRVSCTRSEMYFA